MSVPPLSPSILARMVSVDEIPPGGLQVTVTATDAERSALAAFNNLVAVQSLTAAVVAQHEGRGGVHVSGTVTAEVTQTCVVSLDPFAAEVREPMDVHFLPPDGLAAFRAARVQHPPGDDEVEEDEPDLIENGRIDVGALVAEHLTLGLDPYPRKPGVTLDPTAATPEEPRVSPFAVLRSRDEEQS